LGVEVRLAIDSIVVEGMAARDVPLFRSALSAELQRRAEAVQDWSALSRPTNALSVHYRGRPEDAAIGVANSIFGVSGS
jgi:hypothetical protein